MRTSRPEPHTLAGAYALDALTGADRARFQRHLARCEQCAQEISGLREATARLAAAAAEQPPPGLTERALAAAARTRQLPPAARQTAAPGPARRAGAAGSAGGVRPVRLLRAARMPRLALALTATAMIFAGILGLAARTAQHQLARDQLHSHAIAAVLAAPDATMLTARVKDGGTATIVMSRHARALVFAAAGLPALPSSSCYELWLMGPRGDRPAGMLPRPQHGMTGPVIASGLSFGDRLGLTVEPAGGTPHPTTVVLLTLAL
jgi:anti-sigma-K factor RskA